MAPDQRLDLKVNLKDNIIEMPLFGFHKYDLVIVKSDSIVLTSLQPFDRL